MVCVCEDTTWFPIKKHFKVTITQEKSHKGGRRNSVMVVKKQEKMGSEKVDSGRARQRAFSPMCLEGILKQMVSADRRLLGALMNTLKASQVKYQLTMLIWLLLCQIDT